MIFLQTIYRLTIYYRNNQNLNCSTIENWLYATHLLVQCTQILLHSKNYGSMTLLSEFAYKVCVIQNWILQLGTRAQASLTLWELEIALLSEVSLDNNFCDLPVSSRGSAHGSHMHSRKAQRRALWSRLVSIKKDNISKTANSNWATFLNVQSPNFNPQYYSSPTPKK
jgi:hypothetical protein